MEVNFQESGAAEGAPQEVVTETAIPIETGATDPVTGQPVEIESLDRYQYQGKPLKEWESGYMRQQDYTQKTQAVAQERKYYDNLSIDLERVKNNPALAEQFRQIYPEKFHAYLRYVAGGTPINPQSAAQVNPQTNQQGIPPEVMDRLNRLEATEREREKTVILADLDRKFEKLSSKYPYADEEACVARGQALFAKLREMDPTNPNIQITDKQWDAIWKGVNDRFKGLSESQYKKQVESQLKAGRQGADVGRGGGIPGQAPRQYKSIKEASDALRHDIEHGSV